MAVTYDPIATTTLTGSAVNFTFSSIPTSWTDLRLVITGTPTSSNQDVYIKVNGLSSIYTRVYLAANGTTIQSNAQATQGNFIATQYAYTDTATAGSWIYDFFSYANTSYQKTIMATNSADQNGVGGIDRIIGRAATTSAIDTIAVTLSAGSWATNSTATLYGIKAA